jgi:hypothetical protein
MFRVSHLSASRGFLPLQVSDAEEAQRMLSALAAMEEQIAAAKRAMAAKVGAVLPNNGSRAVSTGAGL